MDWPHAPPRFIRESSTILHSFGITSSQPESQENAVPIFTINIDTGCGAEQQATFDSTTKRWVLSALMTGPETSKTRDEPPQYRVSTNQTSVQRDWTELLPHSDHVNFILSREWQNTEVGPIRQWPSILQLMTHKMLADPRPACLYWYGLGTTPFQSNALLLKQYL